ncbi:hypothetical protein SOP85_11455 [Pseudomonas sp. YuFO20]|jgi:hypothetical protein|uniref:hypothetical protein n=1 Tax=Pseudomonas sp. YuFO20 TaxID=3095362 RepID=UPI002B250AE9|nr:hypothetical protein [Pseudomonas sp. YuFO20]MEB2516053.1 hypothetical protein [Pseudomonas sp. YuFO20]
MHLPPGSVPVLTSPNNVYTRRPLITGDSAPNARIRMVNTGGAPHYGDAQADMNGKWQLQVNTDLHVDPHDRAFFNLAEIDATGSQISTWGFNQLFVTRAPISNPPPTGTPPVLTNPPVLTSSTTVYSLQPLLTGTSRPLARIHVVHSGGFPTYAVVYADANGNWQAPVTTDLIVTPPNIVLIGIAEFDPAGGQISPWTSATLIVNQASTALPPGSPPVLTSSTNVTSLRPWLTGKSAAFERIEIVHSGGFPTYAIVNADANGDWQAPVTTDLLVTPPNMVPIGLAAYNAASGQASPWTPVTLFVNQGP